MLTVNLLTDRAYPPATQLTDGVYIKFGPTTNRGSIKGLDHTRTPVEQFIRQR